MLNEKQYRMFNRLMFWYNNETGFTITNYRGHVEHHLLIILEYTSLNDNIDSI